MIELWYSFDNKFHRNLLDLQRFTLTLPVIDVLEDNLSRGLGGVLATNALNKVVIGVYYRVSINRKNQYSWRSRTIPIR